MRSIKSGISRFRVRVFDAPRNNGLKPINPTRDRKETMSTSPLFLGITSGERQHSPAEIAERGARMAGGFEKLGVGQGDSVCILMRNDIAFIEAAYGAMRLGAYAVPVNWHFKPEEISYVLEESGARVLVGHADLLRQ